MMPAIVGLLSFVLAGAVCIRITARHRKERAERWRRTIG